MGPDHSNSTSYEYCQSQMADPVLDVDHRPPPAYNPDYRPPSTSSSSHDDCSHEPSPSAPDFYQAHHHEHSNRPPHFYDQYRPPQRQDRPCVDTTFLDRESRAWLRIDAEKENPMAEMNNTGKRSPRLFRFRKRRGRVARGNLSK